MVIHEKIGNLQDYETGGRTIDRLPLEWWEMSKRILHKRTAGGKEVVLKFLGETQTLQQDDVLYADEGLLIAVAVLPCAVIVVQPKNLYQTAAACYEIGNKHLPLYCEDNFLLIPYEAPTFRMLQAAGFEVRKEERKLLHPLKTSVAPHGHHGNESLFSRIMKLTATPDAL